MKTLFPILTFMLILFVACNSKTKEADAYGNFEADEIMIPAEVSGKIQELKVTEGDVLQKGQPIIWIDTVQLILKKEQLEAVKRAVSAKVDNVQSQIDVQQEQRKTLERELKRIQNLLKDGAATQQQLDDLTGKINVIDKQIASIQSQNAAIFSEQESYTKQIAQISDQIKRSVIVSPIDATVLEKYIESGEMAMQGKAMVKIANMDKMILRAYISGAQLASVKIGSDVKVRVDKGEKEFSEIAGKIIWVAAQAEFTPKIIQTKEERVNLVYAIKVEVVNDGTIKIGMPGEVVLK